MSKSSRGHPTEFFGANIGAAAAVAATAAAVGLMTEVP